MTNEKLLTEITGIIGVCQDDYANKMLEALITNIRQDMAEKAVTKQGKGTVLAAVKRILKNAEKHTSYDHALRYAAIIDGFQYICDGYHLVKFPNHLPLPELPSGRDYLNVQQFFEVDAKNCDTNLELPDLGRLKAYIKAEKALRKAAGKRGRELDIYFNFGKSEPRCNAEYLVNIMEAVPGCSAKWVNGKKIAPIYFTNGTDEAILMPVNKPDYDETERTEV